MYNLYLTKDKEEIIIKFEGAKREALSSFGTQNTFHAITRSC